MAPEAVRRIKLTSGYMSNDFSSKASLEPTNLVSYISLKLLSCSHFVFTSWSWKLPPDSSSFPPIIPSSLWRHTGQAPFAVAAQWRWLLSLSLLAKLLGGRITMATEPFLGALPEVELKQAVRLWGHHPAQQGLTCAHLPRCSCTSQFPSPSFRLSGTGTKNLQ